MRTITVQLWANNGLGTLAGPCDVSTTIFDMGELSWMLDDRFTKIEPGQFTGRVWDEDGIVWAWLQTQIATTRDGKAQLLRPWVTVTVEGGRAFMGLVDLPSIRRDEFSRIVDLSADDWSVLLQDVVLSGSQWERTMPKGVVARPQAGPWAATRTEEIAADTLYLGLVDVQVGDVLQLAAGGATYPVVEVAEDGVLNFKGRVTASRRLLRLQGWAASGAGSWSFNRLASSSGDLSVYTVTRALTPNDKAPVYAVQLDTVDGIFAGDTMRASKGAEIAVLDVDAERRELISLEPITTALAVGDTLSWSDDTRAQLMYQDAADVLRRAAAPYAVDLTRLTPGTIPQAVLSWLPLRSAGVDLMRVAELEPTLNQVRLLGAAGWAGTPEAGWTFGAVGARQEDWTAQLTAAPAMLMPDGRNGLEGNTRRRNRVYQSKSTYHAPIMVKNDGSIPDDPVYVPRPVAWPTAVYATDYTRYRQLVITNPAETGTGSTVSEQRWSGSAWSAPTAQAWGVAGWHPCSLAPLIGTAATSGPVAPQGLALVALAMSDAGAMELQLVWRGAAYRLAVAAALQGAELVTTPYGTYLIGPGGYGRVRFTGSALALDWAGIYDPETVSLIPSTFVETAAGIFVLAQFQGLSGAGADQKTMRTTGLLHLTPTPDPGNPSAAVLFRETVCAGWAAIAQAIADPSTPGRVLGLLGGRFFQISATVPRTIERMQASGLTAAELVEHVAQLLNAVVIPTPAGVLQVVSRSALSAVTAITVDRSEATEARISKNFFSCVRVTGAQDDLYADAWGATMGGSVMELQSHPLIWTEGGCYALAATFAFFCGKPRRERQETWFHEDASTAPPWESLLAWGQVAVNGGAPWILTALSHDLLGGQGKATLLEVV